MKYFLDEIYFIYKDKFLFTSISIIPLFLFVFMAILFNDGVIRNMPIIIVDFDNTKLSRKLIRAYTTNPTFSVDTSFVSTEEAVMALRESKAYALIEIPPNLQKDILKGQNVNLKFFYNTQFILIGRSIASSVKLTLADFNARLSLAKNLSKGNIVLPEAKGLSIPLFVQMTPIHNIALNYSKFLLSAIMPAILQILIIVTTALSFIVQSRQTGIKNWLKDKGLKGFVMKLFVLQIFFMLMGITFLIYFYMYLSWEFQGSFFSLIFAMWLMIVASQLITCAIYFLVFNPARIISISAAFSAPSLAFIGITFPQNDMNIFAQIWRKLLPVSYYMQVQIKQANYAIAGNFDFLVLFGFIVVFSILTLGLIKARSLI